MSNGHNKGSIWRIWDLHVHSPASYGGEYIKFIENAKSSRAEVIGINDYCTIKGYEEIVKLGGIPGKVIFPVVEFRMHNLLTTKKNPKGIRINFHVIFDNDSSVLTKISTWISSLKCFNEKGENIQLGTAEDFSKLSFDFEKIIESLKEYNLYYSHSLVWLPYDEYGGVDEIDPVSDGFFKVSLINKSHLLGSSTQKQINFFKWTDEKYSIEQYKKWLDKPKPCIKGSDTHKIDYPIGHLMNAQSQPTDRFCWINADMTFMGLKQIVVEPERVFIGNEPDLIKRVRENQTKFIKSLSVKKLESAILDDIWFDNFEIELNSSLVAIIGNKGGGKSAITDIIGLCGNTHQEPTNFSFLNKDKFRKPKPINLSEKFEATLYWQDGTPITKRLSENPDKVLAERVKYIPQNFLERLCADIESDAFEKELKQIIYSHTSPEKRLGKSSLDDLINYKSSLVNAEITKTQTDISNLNTKIVSLENKATPDFKKSLESLLEMKKGELAAHISVEPKKPETGDENMESNQLVEKLTKMRETIAIFEEEVAELRKKNATLLIKQEELYRSQQFYRNTEEQLKRIQDVNSEFVQILMKNGIEPASIFSFKIDTTEISNHITNVLKEISDIDAMLDIENEASKVNNLRKLNEELKQGQEVLDKPAKDKQKFLDDLKNWEAKKKELEGNEDTEGTLKYYEAQLLYLNEKLTPELAKLYNERKSYMQALYSKKISLIEIRKELFKPVTQFIDDFKELNMRYDVKIDVALEPRDFENNFFNFINQNKSGTFFGKEDGYRKLTDIIERASFVTSSGLDLFTEELIDNLKHDNRNGKNQKIDIISQLRKGIELSQLYDFIYNLDWRFRTMLTPNSDSC